MRIKSAYITSGVKSLQATGRLQRDVKYSAHADRRFLRVRLGRDKRVCIKYTVIITILLMIKLHVFVEHL